MAPERHLIVCEGKKTEPLYFQGMRDALRPEFRNRIHIVVKGTGLHTTDLFEYALRECRLSGGFDHVWLAYDRDDFDFCEFDSVVDKCVQNSDETTTFHPLWSNPCVEVWMLLHFGYTTAEMTSVEAIARTDVVFQRELKHPYSKTATGLFEEFRYTLSFDAEWIASTRFIDFDFRFEELILETMLAQEDESVIVGILNAVGINIDGLRSRTISWARDCVERKKVCTVRSSRRKH
ncbi:RloB family protein [Adlercreutzia sp. ZJ154]|uniref:RloB family protein n=1 Tax=Adlercreutzia sp. ZJ154 TaxID=2709790 RepID=UPI0013EC0EFA|nr:RloB family protein [Adlercreutzia sp. ZJ154]